MAKAAWAATRKNEADGNDAGKMATSAADIVASLHDAAKEGEVDTLAEILEAHAESYKQSGSGSGPGPGSGSEGELIDAGDPANGWRAIHYAVAYDQVEVVRFLILDWADLDARTHKGKTACMMAEEYMRREGTVRVPTRRDNHHQRMLCPTLPTYAPCHTLHTLGTCTVHHTCT